MKTEGVKSHGTVPLIKMKKFHAVQICGEKVQSPFLVPKTKSNLRCDTGQQKLGTMSCKRLKLPLF